jgi:uncharacterized protein
MSKEAFMNLKFLGLTLITGCASYTEHSRSMREALYNEHFEQAMENLDKSRIASSSQDYVLYKMERGMLAYLNQKYSSAIQELKSADDKIEELYTTSLTRTAATFIINDSMSDYSGEAHERVLLPLFASIAYFANQEPNKARAEIRRTYELLNALQEENKGKNSFKRDAFAHYLSGFVYESQKEWDAAIVEYRTALESLEGELPSSEAIELIGASLGSLAEYRKRPDMIKLAQKAYPSGSWEKLQDLKDKGEILVIYECGKSSIKVPQDFFLPLGDSLVRISFPVYVRQTFLSQGATVTLNGERAGRTLLLEDIDEMARKSLEDRRLKDFAKMTARLIAKGALNKKLSDANPLLGLVMNVTSLITETADTRSWTSLPANLQVLRKSIPSHSDVIVRIEPQYGKPFERILNVKPGEKRLLRIRTFT